MTGNRGFPMSSRRRKKQDAPWWVELLDKRWQFVVIALAVSGVLLALAVVLHQLGWALNAAALAWIVFKTCK
jgi:hypothetical protein